MKLSGLSKSQAEPSRTPDLLWKKILGGLRDPMIMILLAALVIRNGRERNGRENRTACLAVFAGVS